MSAASQPPRIFTRPARPSKWNPSHLAGPMPDLTLREWELGIFLEGFAPPLRQALCEALKDPASPGCRRFQREIGYWRPNVEGRLTPTLNRDKYRDYVSRELAAIWYLLDHPLLACTGMARALLVIEHRLYLRRLLDALTRQPGTRASTRWRISPAALLVKVMARMLPGRTPWRSR